MMRKTFSFILGVLLISLTTMLFIGCGSGQNGGAGSLTKILVTPITAVISTEGRVSFTALGVYSGGTISTLSPTWGATGLGSIDSSGTFIAGTLEGTTTISALYQGLTGTSRVTIVNTTPTLGAMVSIEITPLYFQVAIGQTQVCTVTGYDISHQVVPVYYPTWDFSGGTVGSLVANSPTTAVFTATSAGTAVITCTSLDATNISTVTVEGNYIEITCEADTYIDENDFGSHAASTELLAGDLNGNTRALLKFAVPSLEGLSSIESLELLFYVSDATQDAYSIFYIGGSPGATWNEDLTWNDPVRILVELSSLPLTTFEVNTGASNIVDLRRTLAENWFWDPTTNSGMVITGEAQTLLKLASRKNKTYPAPFIRMIYK